MLGARRTDVVARSGALRGGGVGEPRADPFARGLHLEAPPGLGVDQRDQPDRGELELARVDDLDREHVVARRQHAERARPVVACEEVGDHHDQSAAPRDAYGATAARRQGRRRGAVPLRVEAPIRYG